MVWEHRGFWIFPILITIVLATLSLLFSRGRLHRVYVRVIADTRREKLFLASVGFFTAVAVVRGLTLAIHYGVGGFHDVSMGGRHIHHLVWGILLLLAVGYGWLLELGTGEGKLALWMGRLLAMVYGVGSALTLDEFALWLNLRDVYWQREGRESFEALALFGALLSIGIFGKPLFQGLGRELAKPFRSAKQPT